MRAVASRTYAMSLAGVMVAAGLCAVAIVRAVMVEPVEPGEPAMAGVASAAEIAGEAPSAVRVPSEAVLGMESLSLAVDHDPFMPDRRRSEPYRLPDERFTGRVEAREEAPVEPPPFRVIGTASAGSRSMALVQPLESGGEIDMVLVGGNVQGYRLESVDDESATLVMRDRAFRLGIQEGMAGGPGGRTNGSQSEALRRLTEELRERGLSPEAIERFLQSNGTAVWSPLGLGQRGLFSGQLDFSSGWVGTPAEREVRVFEVPAQPEPRRLPSVRAGRGGRMSADTIPYEPG